MKEGEKDEILLYLRKLKVTAMTSDVIKIRVEDKIILKGWKKQ